MDSEHCETLFAEIKALAQVWIDMGGSSAIYGQHLSWLLERKGPRVKNVMMGDDLEHIVMFVLNAMIDYIDPFNTRAMNLRGACIDAQNRVERIIKIREIYSSRPKQGE